jgi:hypothetical protein
MDDSTAFRQLETLRRRFDDAAQRWAFFPVIRATEDDGTLSISVPSGVPADARREMDSLAAETENSLREVGVALSGPPRKESTGRWLAWVFRKTLPVAAGEWTEAPLSETNPLEFE